MESIAQAEDLENDDKLIAEEIDLNEIGKEDQEQQQAVKETEKVGGIEVIDNFFDKNDDDIPL